MSILIEYGAIANQNDDEDNESDENDDADNDSDEDGDEDNDSDVDDDADNDSDEDGDEDNDSEDDDDNNDSNEVDDNHDKKCNAVGYGKLMNISSELQAVIGVKKATRSEVFSLIWDYIVDNKLQDPEAKQYFICDEKLGKVIGKQRCKVFGMAMYLNHHMHSNEIGRNLDDIKPIDVNEQFLKAVKNGDSFAVQKLLNQETSSNLLKLDFKEGDYDTPLHYACKYGHFEVVKLLLENGASENVNLISSALHKATSLHYRENLFEIVGELLKHGAIIDFQLQYGPCTLQYSGVYERKELLSFLIENGSYEPRQKKTRLHWAARFGLTDLVEKFLVNGDDPNPRNITGKTPYDVAKEFYEDRYGGDDEKKTFHKIMSILIKYGGIANQNDDEDNDDAEDDDDDNDSDEDDNDGDEENNDSDEDVNDSYEK